MFELLDNCTCHDVIDGPINTWFYANKWAMELNIIRERKKKLHKLFNLATVFMFS